MNKAILIGNLGNDPEVRQTNSGTNVCNFRMATSRKYTKNDEQVEETEWHRVVVWGKQAEHCGEFLSKGRQVAVEGRIQTKSYETDSGEKKYSTEIVADRVQFLGGKGEAKKSDAPANF